VLAAGFLVRTSAERERLLDMSRRLRPAKASSVVLLAIAAIASIPVYGWQMQVPLVAAILAFSVIQLRIDRARRPELLLAGSWLFAQAAIVAAILLAGGPRVYALPILVVPMLMGAAVFPGRVVAAGTAITAGLILATAFGAMGDLATTMPPTWIVPITVLLEVTLLASGTVQADQTARQSAVIDQLTGLLNRSALQARAVEITSRLSRSDATRVAIIVADIDHFKAVNDDHGHATGDEVLAEVASRLARTARHRASLYRYGGEEFILIAEEDAAEEAEAAALAERLRAAVSGSPIAGLHLTLSLGVACSGEEATDCAALVDRADRALYGAKAAGRNQVCLAPADEPDPAQHDEEQVVLLNDKRAQRPSAPAATADDKVACSEPPRANRRRAGWHGMLRASPAEREHMLDIIQRVTDIGRVGDPLALAALIALAPWLGWAPLIPIAIAVALMQTVHVFVLPRVRRTEVALGGALIAQLGAGLYVLLSRQPMLALPLLTILIFPGTAAAPAPTAVLQTVFAATVMTTVALLAGTDELLANPSILLLPLALLGTVALFGYGIGQSTIAHRTAAAIDPLTGTLSRAALRSRVAELARGNAGSEQPLAMLIADLDHFKQVNDTHGHAVGDAVLAAVATRLRTALRTFDSVYRIGGEEFLVLLVGVDEPEALEVAERLRAAVSERPVEDLPLTVSVGLALCPAGEEFVYEPLFAAADDALLAAKAAGRNRVLVATPAASAIAAA
jgi:diguanylate cyclase (GGDEF)-like protein